MQLSSDAQIPDGLLAANALLREKPHQGLPSWNLAPHQGIDERNSTAAIGLRASAQLNRIWPRYTGKERDAESGNDYFEARYYSSAMGRFMSPDWSAKEEPIPYATMDDPQSLNLYSYVRNNPLSRVDADGHCAEDLCIAEGLIVLGVGLEAAREAYNMTPDGQRSLNNLANAFGASFSSNISSAKNAITGVFSKETAPPNPAGQKGAPDHEAAVKEEADKARAAAGPGETVLEGKKIQGHDSTRRPDVQTVGADGKAHTVVEVERRPNHARHKTRQAEYDNLGVKHRTRPLPPKTQGQN